MCGFFASLPVCAMESKPMNEEKRMATAAINVPMDSGGAATGTTSAPSRAETAARKSA